MKALDYYRIRSTKPKLPRPEDKPSLELPTRRRLGRQVKTGMAQFRAGPETLPIPHITEAERQELEEKAREEKYGVITKAPPEPWHRRARRTAEDIERGVLRGFGKGITAGLAEPIAKRVSAGIAKVGIGPGYTKEEREVLEKEAEKEQARVWEKEFKAKTVPGKVASAAGEVTGWILGPGKIARLFMGPIKGALVARGVGPRIAQVISGGTAWGTTITGFRDIEKALEGKPVLQVLKETPRDLAVNVATMTALFAAGEAIRDPVMKGVRRVNLERYLRGASPEAKRQAKAFLKEYGRLERNLLNAGLTPQQARTVIFKGQEVAGRNPLMANLTTEDYKTIARIDQRFGRAYQTAQRQQMQMPEAEMQLAASRILAKTDPQLLRYYKRTDRLLAQGKITPERAAQDKKFMLELMIGGGKGPKGGWRVWTPGYKAEKAVPSRLRPMGRPVPVAQKVVTAAEAPTFYTAGEAVRKPAAIPRPGLPTTSYDQVGAKIAGARAKIFAPRDVSRLAGVMGGVSAKPPAGPVVPKIKPGDIIRDDLVQGRVVGEGFLGTKKIPVYKVEILSGHQKGQVGAIAKKEARIEKPTPEAPAVPVGAIPKELEPAFTQIAKVYPKRFTSIMEEVREAKNAKEFDDNLTETLHKTISDSYPELHPTLAVQKFYSQAKPRAVEAKAVANAPPEVAPPAEVPTPGEQKVELARRESDRRMAELAARVKRGVRAPSAVREAEAEMAAEKVVAQAEKEKPITVKRGRKPPKLNKRQLEVMPEIDYRRPVATAQALKRGLTKQHKQIDTVERNKGYEHNDPYLVKRRLEITDGRTRNLNKMTPEEVSAYQMFIKDHLSPQLTGAQKQAAITAERIAVEREMSHLADKDAGRIPPTEPPSTDMVDWENPIDPLVNTSPWSALSYGKVFPSEMFGEGVVGPFRDARYDAQQFHDTLRNEIYKAYGKFTDKKYEALRIEMNKALTGQKLTKPLSAEARQAIIKIRQMRDRWFDEGTRAGILELNQYVRRYGARIIDLKKLRRLGRHSRAARKKYEELVNKMDTSILYAHPKVKAFFAQERTGYLWPHIEDPLMQDQIYSRVLTQAKFYEPIRQRIKPLLDKMPASRRLRWNKWFNHGLLGRTPPDARLMNKGIEDLGHRLFGIEMPRAAVERFSSWLYAVSYSTGIGLPRIKSTIKNYFQKMLILEEIGNIPFFTARRLKYSPKIKWLYDECKILKGRMRRFEAVTEEAYQRPKPGVARRTKDVLRSTMLPFRLQDQDSVKHAFLGGVCDYYYHAVGGGPKHPVKAAKTLAGAVRDLRNKTVPFGDLEAFNKAKEAGESLAYFTQYPYGIDNPYLMIYQLGKYAGQFETWPLYYARFLGKRVFTERGQLPYAKGKGRRKWRIARWLYLSLLAGWISNELAVDLNNLFGFGPFQRSYASPMVTFSKDLLALSQAVIDHTRDKDKKSKARVKGAAKRLFIYDTRIFIPGYIGIKEWLRWFPSMATGYAYDYQTRKMVPTTRAERALSIFVRTRPGHGIGRRGKFTLGLGEGEGEPTAGEKTALEKYKELAGVRD